MRFSLALLLAAFALQSCSDATGVPAPERSTMSAAIGDEVFEMKSVLSDRVELRYYVSGDTELEPPNRNIIISFDSLTAPVEITIGPKTTHLARPRYRVRSADGSVEEYEAISGTVKVESIEATKASGTFDFIARLVGGSRQVIVSSGRFSTVERN